MRSIVLRSSAGPATGPASTSTCASRPRICYQAQRSYSIATPADGQRITITVERPDDGEVSPYLVDELRSGDEIELRGLIGGWFVWEPALGGPLQLVAGGSGVVPLMAMLRAWWRRQRRASALAAVIALSTR